MGRYFSAIDRFFNKFRKKGLVIYASLVVGAVLYSCYTISNLPDLDLDRNNTDKDGERRKKTLKSGESERNADKHTEQTLLEKELAKDHNEIDHWSRKQLYEYLSKHKVFPNLEEEHQALVERAKAIFYSDQIPFAK